MAGDCAAFLLFGLIGLTSHEESVTVQIVVRSLLVFPAAWLLVAPWFAVLRSEWPKARWRKVLAGRVARGGDDRPVGRSLIFDRELLERVLRHRTGRERLVPRRLARYLYQVRAPTTPDVGDATLSAREAN